MNKFENVDVLASLQQIMQQNTAAFQNDFDIDKKILTQAAKSKNAEDKVYLWFSRPNGTHCLCLLYTSSPISHIPQDIPTSAAPGGTAEKLFDRAAARCV